MVKGIHTTHTHTPTYMHTHTSMHRYAHIHTHTHVHTHVHTHKHTYTHTETHTCTHTCTHTVHACTHTHKRKNTLTHTSARNYVRTLDNIRSIIACVRSKLNLNRQMSGRKRGCEPCSSNGTQTTKKRTVSKWTAEKWVKEFDKDLNTETADHDHVVSLSCALCTQFQDKLVGMRNYRTSFIDGTSNVRTSSFKEHATTDMHVRAMHLFRKQQSTSVFQYAPIAKRH